jgi:MmyB-like transcription regulator ligand binding domain/Helix-turn-helix domain
MARGDVGLPAAGRGRETGLRREEVSYLSGVSITWYTWLEQGREIMPSRQVLDAIACTLRLSGPEHAYVLALAGYSADSVEPDFVPPALPAHVEHLLDALSNLPVYVLAPDWTILGWTPAFAAVYPKVATVPDEDRNLLWLAFTDPYLHDLLGNWKAHSTRSLAKFRAEAGPHLSEPPFARLIQRLLENSEHFRVAWENRDIEPFGPRRRTYHHPVVGDLHFELHHITVIDQHRLFLVIFTPVPGTATAARLQRAASAGAGLDSAVEEWPDAGM